MRVWLLVVVLCACGGEGRPVNTDPLEALAQCVRDAGLTDVTNVDSEAAKEHMREFCPELVEP